jgi:PGF-CTERM protein
MNIFTLNGAGSLQGSDAAQALIEAINDPNVDDTYTKFQFIVANPYIRITPITDKRIGENFTISAETNLALDDEVLVEVYSSSFKPTTTGTVRVEKGENGLNKIAVNIDTSNFKSDEYIVKEDAIIQEATGTAIFNVLDASAVVATPTKAATPVPTPVVVTAAPTPAQTLPPAVVTTANVTAKQTQSPGYGALLALIGLAGVAFVVVRRE